MVCILSSPMTITLKFKYIISTQYNLRKSEKSCVLPSGSISVGVGYGRGRIEGKGRERCW